MLLRKELPASTDRPAGKQPRQQAECPQQRPASLPWPQDNRSSRVPVYLPGQVVDPARKREAGLGEPQHSPPFAALLQNAPAPRVGRALLPCDTRQRPQPCHGETGARTAALALRLAIHAGPRTLHPPSPDSRLILPPN